MLIFSRSRGFSMIELMIGIVIMAILVAAGFPAYTTYLENAKIRSAASTFATLLDLARSEAVRRNAQVEFAMLSVAADFNNIESTAYSTTGINWMVRAFDPTSGLHTFIEGKRGREGSGAATTAGVHMQVSGTVSSVTFNGLGATTLATTATFDFANPTGGACANASTPGPMRCLRVVVSVGGQARVCDPKMTGVAGDTRAC